MVSQLRKIDRSRSVNIYGIVNGETASTVDYGVLKGTPGKSEIATGLAYSLKDPITRFRTLCANSGIDHAATDPERSTIYGWKRRQVHAWTQTEEDKAESARPRFKPPVRYCGSFLP